MPPQIGLQLYSLREAAAKDYEGVVRRVAKMGYAGVEPALLTTATAASAARLYQELGLTVPSVHVAMPVGDKKNEPIDIAKTIGAWYVISGFGPDSFKTIDGIKATCDIFNVANANVTAAGLRFGVHNHWWEYTKVEGRYPYEIMLERLDPAITFEIDTYWVKTAGADPVAVVKQMGKRSPLLHIKDGPCVKELPMSAVGDGIMDVPAVVKAGEGSAWWLIVEIDRVAGDMFEAVQRSVDYLAGQKLGVGK
jgi:sugar phosphate isomerase/epimerase